jgi:hypothetical protein
MTRGGEGAKCLGKDVNEKRILHLQAVLVITPGHSLRGGKNKAHRAE